MLYYQFDKDDEFALRERLNRVQEEKKKKCCTSATSSEENWQNLQRKKRERLWNVLHF